MKDATGVMLREVWQALGRQDCRHPDCSPEYSFSGTQTGFAICTTCGARIEMDRTEQDQPKALPAVTKKEDA